MNWAALAAVAALLGLIATLVIVPYTYGKLTQEVVETRSKTAEHAIIIGAHGERITQGEIKIGKIEEWKAGFSTGAHLNSKEVQ